MDMRFLVNNNGLPELFNREKQVTNENLLIGL